MLRPMKNADRRPLPVRIFRFYYDGFREMTLGRTLWAIILIKLFINQINFFFSTLLCTFCFCQSLDLVLKIIRQHGTIHSLPGI